MTIRIFVAAMLSATGFAIVAFAVVLWDRRRRLHLNTSTAALIALLLVLVGAALAAGSCVGAFRF